MSRTALYERKTKETRISVSLALDGTGAGDIRTPIAFLSHMLGTMAAYGRFDLRLAAEGDMDVDQHHLVEDWGCASASLRRALGSPRIRRAGPSSCPWTTRWRSA
jgi:imidazoleglycerol-phosphate dehydratase